MTGKTDWRRSWHKNKRVGVQGSLGTQTDHHPGRTGRFPGSSTGWIMGKNGFPRRPKDVSLSRNVDLSFSDKGICFRWKSIYLHMKREPLWSNNLTITLHNFWVISGHRDSPTPFSSSNLHSFPREISVNNPRSKPSIDKSVGVTNYQWPNTVTENWYRIRVILWESLLTSPNVTKLLLVKPEELSLKWKLCLFVFLSNVTWVNKKQETRRNVI